jgi:hypothetical protein
MTASAGLGISLSVVNQNLNIVNTGILTASSGAGISLSVVNQNLNVVNTGILTASAGLGISLSVVNQNLNVINTGILTASAGSGISLSVVDQNLNVINTGVLTASAGAGISLSIVGGNLNVVNTITNNNQLTNGAGYITSSALTGYATETYVGTQISNLVDAAPGTLDTLNELAAALGDDPNFATTVSTSIGTKVPQARTITINGTSYDLTANRSWTINSMVYPSAGIALSTGTAWGTSITDNSANWNTAYGWGNHASGGYLTTASAASTYVSLTGSYANPSWITSLAYSKITGVPSFLTSYTETDTLASVTNRGNSTTGAITVNGSTTIKGAIILDDLTSNLIQHKAGTDVNTLVTVGHGGFDHAGYLRLNGADVATQSYVTSRGYITSYTETDTLSSVTSRGASTSATISAANFQNAYQVLSLNNIKVPGLYNYDGGISGTQPLGTEWYNVRTIEVGASARYSQFVMPYSATRIFYRISTDAGFQPYVELYHSGNLTNLNQLTNGPGYITGYTETDTLASVTGRGATTSSPITINGGGSQPLSLTTSSGSPWHLALVRSDLGLTSRVFAHNSPYNGWYFEHNISIAGNTNWHSGNLTNLNQLSNGPGYITGYTETDTLASVTGRGASTASQVSFTKTDDHAISVGTIRGRAVGSQTGEFIQLYERVNIGGPNGWGAANTAAPAYGLSVHGGANIGYGNNASLFAYAYRGNGNVAGTGEASHHPAGIYSTGTNWLYGTMYMNNNAIRDVQEVYNNGWFRTVSHQGLYNPTNDAHFYPNNASYGSWRIDGTRNGWHGLHFNSGATLMMNSSETGVHKEAVGWQWRWDNGIFYVHQAGGGGGGNAVWHAGNFTPGNYLPLSGGELSGPTYKGTIASGVYATHWKDGSGSYIEAIGNSTATRKLRLQSFNGSSSYAQWFMDGGNMQIYGDVAGNRNFLIDSTTAYIRHNGADKLWGGSDGTRNSGWAYHNNNDTGLHWPNNGWHFYPKDVNDMYMRSGSSSNVAIAMSTAGTVRGYVYAENDNTIGFLTNGRGWAFRTYSNGNAQVYGYLTVNGAGTSSSIYMNDSDEGQREIHCNSNRIGFLTQSGSWGAYLDDSTNWYADGSMRSPIFYDSDNLSYYLDPNSNSRLLFAQFDNIGVGQGYNSSYRIITSGDIYLNANANGWAEGVWKQRRGGGTYYDVIDAGNIGSQSVFSASLVASNSWSSSSGNEAVRVFAPAGASASWDGGITGAFRIKLPQRANNTMWSMKVRIYNYATNHTAEYTMGNYSYDQGGYNASAHFIGGVNAGVHNVRFGNQDGVDCVWIGETSTGWSYPVVSVIDFQGGFRNGNASSWDDGWNITYVTSFGTVATTIYPSVKFGDVYAPSINASNIYASSDVRGNDVYTTGGWFRNHTNSNGIYWSATGWHLMPADSVYFRIHSGSSSEVALRMETNGTTRGYIYADNSNNIGFLNTSAAWRFRVDNGGRATMYGPIARNAHSSGFLEGSYNNIGGNSQYTNPIYTIGSSYNPTDSSLSNMYGIGYAHPNLWGSGKTSSWGLYVCEAGTINATIGGGSTTIWAQNDIVAYSDARVKDNIEVVENAVEKIQAIRGVTFTRTDANDKDRNKRHAGVIAQEVLKVLPEVVSGTEEDMYSVAYGNMAALFIEAIKEQQKQIEELQNKLDNVLSSR